MDGHLKIKTKIDNSGFNAQIKVTERKLNDLKATLESNKTGSFKLTENEVVDLNKEIEKTTNQLNKLKKKQLELDSKNFNNMKDSIDNVGSSITKTISKVGKWALAVFGVRSAYNAVRNAASTLSQYNSQIGTDLEYIRYAMASALQPVIEKLISLAFKFLTYANMISKAWFGVDLFAKSSANNFNKANKNAKNMQKTLSKFSFDDINKLEDNSNSDSDSGTSIPSFDLSSPEDVPIPSWLQWLIDNGDIVKLIIEGIAATILALKFNLDLIQGIGLFLIIDGVVNLIKDFITLLKDPSWKNFGKVLEDIGFIILGLSLAFGSWKLGLVGLAVFVVGLVIENWDKIMEVLGKIGNWVWENVLQPIINFFSACFDTITNVIKFWFSWIQALFVTLINLLLNPFIVLKDTVVGVFNGIKTTIQGVFNIIKGLFTGDWKLVMDGFKQTFKGVFDSLWSIAKAPLNLIIGGLNALINGANKISFDVPSWVPGLGGKKFGFNIPTIKKLATGGIIDVPKRGVPLASNVIGGEAGAEGVLPLTNPETMARLGREIGQWITLNIDLTSKIDMRILCREIIKYMKENDFARNGA